MTQPSSIHTLDVVALSREIEGWPAGTPATVVDERDGRLVVEVSEGASDDLVVLPVDRGDVVLVSSARSQAAAS